MESRLAVRRSVPLACALEVSSHALSQDRAAERGVEIFRIGVIQHLHAVRDAIERIRAGAAGTIGHSKAEQRSHGTGAHHALA